MVPSFGVQGEGGITLAGAVEGEIRYVSSVTRWGSLQSVSFTALDPDSGLEENPIFSVQQGPDPASASLSVRRESSVEYYYGLFPEGGPAFTFDGTRFTIPEITVVASDGSGREVLAGGSLRFPEISLSPGVETVVNTDPDPYRGWTSITVNADGTFSQLFEWGTVSGTWTIEKPGEITLRLDDDTAFYSYRIEGEALEMMRSPDQDCECLEDTEAFLLVEPGTFESVRYVYTASFRKTSGP